MDYNKLTKQELLELVIQQQTLKDAVEEKDNEIQKLLKERDDYKNKNLELTHISKDIKPLKDAVESKDSEIQKLLKEREELKTKVHESSTLNNDIKTLKSLIADQQKDISSNKKLVFCRFKIPLFFIID